MFRPLSFAEVALAVLLPSLPAQTATSYFPARDKWEKKAPAELGLDAAKLQQAVEYAQAHGSEWDFARDQLKTFGPPLGPVPTQRAPTTLLP